MYCITTCAVILYSKFVAITWLSACIKEKVGCKKFFNQAHANRSVRLVSRSHFCAATVCVCVCVCVSTPEAINN